MRKRCGAVGHLLAAFWLAQAVLTPKLFGQNASPKPPQPSPSSSAAAPSNPTPMNPAPSGATPSSSSPLSAAQPAASSPAPAQPAPNNPLATLLRLEETRQCFALKQMLQMQQVPPAERDFLGASTALQFRFEAMALQSLEGQLPSAKGERRKRILELLREGYTKLGAYGKASGSAKALLAEFPGYRTVPLTSTAKLLTALAMSPPQTAKLSPPHQLPFTRDEFGLPVVDLTVNGTATPMLLDTGASLSLITASLAKRLRLTPLPGQFSVGSIVGRDVSAGVTVANSVVLGGARLQNVVFLVVRDEDLRISSRWQGVLGASALVALQHLRFRKTGLLEIGGPSPAANAEPNLCFQQESMVAAADYANRGLMFILDTGATSTRFHPSFYRAFGSKLATSDTTLRTGGLGGGSSIPAKRAGDIVLTVGGRKVLLKNPLIAMQPTSNASLTTSGNMGWDAFQQAEAIVFDFRKMQFTLE